MSQDMNEEHLAGAIAVVGMACRFPGARNVDEYWENLCAGKESIERLGDEALRLAGVEEEELRSHNYVKAAAILDDMEMFDGEFFGFSPKESAIMDPQHRHFLECGWEALEHAGYDPLGYPGAIGCFAGCGMQSYFARNLLPNRHLIDSTGYFLVRHTGNDKDFMSTRLAYHLNLRGPCVSVQTACSTSLVAIHLASQSLLAHECDMALAGGVSIEVPHRRGYFYEEGEILSNDGHCRPFDAKSTGTVFGSGAGVVVLRRLKDALDAGDAIHAVLLGSAINNDGHGKVSYLAPSVDGQAVAIADALGVAGVESSTIGYVETHGTGTQIGDPIEIAALTKAFRETSRDVSYCALGAVKSNFGHLDTAAGVAGFIKAVLAVKFGRVPATLHYASPNPKIQFDSTPFYVNASLRELRPVGGASRRRAGVNSLGVGGTNAHVIIEEPPTVESQVDENSASLIVLSARSPDGLDRAAERLRVHLNGNPSICLADAAFTLQNGRHSFAHRRVFVARNGEEASGLLALQDRKRVFSGHAAGKGAQVAFMFPGGGAQYPGMGRELHQMEAGFRSDIEEGLAIIETRWGVPLRSLMFPEPGAEAAAALSLEEPLHSILTIFIVEYALARLWISKGVRPSVMTGHSLGEYTAACLAGVMTFEEAIRIVVARGRIFQKLERGAMLSVALPESEVKSWLEGSLCIAAVNAPQLCVVSGTEGEIHALQERLVTAEVECQVLKIAVAAHSAMLEPYLNEFREACAGVRFRAPSMRFISNLSGAEAEGNEVATVDYWVRHLRNTVRFSAGVESMLAAFPDALLLEVGPGNTLCSLARLHLQKGREPVAIPTMRHPKEAGSDWSVFLLAYGRLWAGGYEVSWDWLYEGRRRFRIPLPSYPFEKKRHWIDETPSGLGVAQREPGRLVRRADVEQWLAVPVWEESEAEARSDHAVDVILFVGEMWGIGEEVRQALHRQTEDGAKVICAVRGKEYPAALSLSGRFEPGAKASWAQLVEGASALAKKGLLVVSSLGDGAIDGADQWPGDVEWRMEETFFEGVRLMQALGEGGGACASYVRFLSCGAFDIAGEGSADAFQHSLAGACRVMRREFPQADVRFVDLPERIRSGERPRLGEALACEILMAGGEEEVALRNGRRWIRKLGKVKSVKRPGASSLLKEEGVYLITGGLGGLGLELARHLAAKYRARLVLLSRRGLSERTDAEVIKDELSKLKGAADAVVMTADVCDKDRVEDAVRLAEERFGRIDGVFHCAGELDDGVILGKTDEGMRRVLRPKVLGAITLDRVFQTRKLDFMVFYSSVSSWVGLPGQVDYAAANAFLDALAQRSFAHSSRLVLSLGWGAWNKVGMAARMAGVEERGAGVGAENGNPLLVGGPENLDDKVVFGSIQDANANWMLDGHRTKDEGIALMPGTAYLELAQGALSRIHPTGQIMLSDVVFESPMVVEGKTELRFTWDSIEREFVIASRAVEDESAGPWIEHVRGSAEALSRAGKPPVVDLSLLKERCSKFNREFLGDAPSTRQEQLLRFGARWRCLQNAWYGAAEALGELRLPEAFHADLPSMHLHPALLDIATGFALPLVEGYDEADTFYVPLMYRRVVVHRALPAIAFSHARCADVKNADTVVFDVTIMDGKGEAVVELEGFTMKRLPEAKLVIRQERPRRAKAMEFQTAGEMSLKSMVEAGIMPSEGMNALEMLLTHKTPPQVLCSPLDPEAWRRVLDEAKAPAGGGEERQAEQAGMRAFSQPRPNIATPLVLPSGEVEERIASIWRDALGVETVGIDDNFFELGGHSLALVQVIVKCRKALKADIPVGNAEVLANPTVRLFARFAARKEKDEQPAAAPIIKRLARDRYRVSMEGVAG
jgi:acyl transferase domain-containing protein/NADP-dependent 3-hydroxy acid dehydrogenase YdfG/acyl carrier protein